MESINPNQETVSTAPASVNRGLTKKSKIIIVICIVLLILGIEAFLYIRNNYPQKPQENTFYIGVYHNAPILFYRNKDMHISGIPADPYMGDFVSYEKSMSGHQHSDMHMHFRDLQSPQQLFQFERYATIESFKLSDDKAFLMLSFMGGKLDTTNYIYQINLKTHKSEKIWEHEFGSGNAPYNEGVASIVQFIPDRYVVFSLSKASALPTKVPASLIIRNIQSGRDSILGAVGDIQISESSNTVSYKTLSKTQVPCEGKMDPACFETDTYKMAYKPTGKVVTQPLP